MRMNKADEWTLICKAYAKSIGATVIFINTENYDFGFETKDGKLVHLYANELFDLLKND